VNEVLWYSARAGGLVAWLLLSAATIWGLVLSGPVRPRRVRPAWTLDLHRFLGGLATIFTVVHVASVMLDAYVHFGVVDVLVPFASQWSPAAVAGGVVAAYLVVAVEVTSLARRHLPKRIWRRVHTLAFPLFVSATLHFVSAGSEATSSLVQVAVLAVCGLVAGLTVLRVAQRRTGRSRPATTRLVLSGGALVRR
jgi:DMSO/TMAO reductase YedYZ heme-binding membrane subunit